MTHHIVPHWDEHTNFMPLFAEARVMPEHLQVTYRKLLARFRRVGARGGAKKRSRA